MQYFRLFYVGVRLTLNPNIEVLTTNTHTHTHFDPLDQNYLNLKILALVLKLGQLVRANQVESHPKPHDSKSSYQTSLLIPSPLLGRPNSIENRSVSSVT